MNQTLILAPQHELLPALEHIPDMIVSAGDAAIRRYVEFFTASIRNRGTRTTYANAVRQFCRFCEEHGITLTQVTPIVVATYLDFIRRELSDPSVKLHLSAIRMLFDYFVIGQIIPMNPAASVRGPKHVVKKGKTPVLTAEEARQLLESIETNTEIGLRDRALIGVMLYSFARVSAVIGMNVDDYYSQGRRTWFRLHEKGGKHHEVPAHHKAEEFLDAYLSLLFGEKERKTPLFRSISRSGTLTNQRLHRVDALRMIKRRAAILGFSDRICCHSFRATGITIYLECGGSLEHAQKIAAHESARTTKLYDRTNDAISLDEIERIVI